MGGERGEGGEGGTCLHAVGGVRCLVRGDGHGGGRGRQRRVRNKP